MGDRADWLRQRRSFGAVAGAYAQLRPGYPDEVAGYVLGSRSRRVLDLGAGTGKLTGAVLAAGHEVLAVDPSPEMLAELSARHPAVVTAVGTAEAIPLPDGAVDAVVAGQAAHWFDLDAAGSEMARVLRTGGVIGLVWNIRDERVRWVAELSTVLEGENNHATTDLDRISQTLAETLDFEVGRQEFGYVHVLEPEQVVNGLATRSYLALLEPEERQPILDSARRLLATHPDTTGLHQVPVPYRTYVYRLAA